MGEGDFIKKPDRRFKLLVIIQSLWVITLLILALWWGTLLKQQGDEIATLETQLGTPEHQVQTRLTRTTRMISGESGTFVLLILITNGVLLFFFARDTKRSRSLEAFFASMTHELRTPLTSIRLQAEMIKDLEEDPKRQTFVNRLLEDVSRLEGQVQQSLELARIEGGGEITSQPVKINNFIQNKILPQYAFSDRKVTLEVELDEAFVLADLSALNIIFRNIFDNAFKYSSESPVILSIKGEKTEAHYFLSVDHKNASFKGESVKLGSLFYRGSNSHGAGVGLYLISTLMQKMKGTADFIPKEKQFSTHLCFPIEKGEIAHG
ncbi:MAG: HAMP domain-containing histidine kinase [Bdellovibrionales bacterium]|nr:HAMP domain-containing histidine kinase [Oligoflexia bacterium]